jgi:hypothetical protein
MERNTSGLALGTAVRSRRAALKKRIAAGEVDVAQLLDGKGDEADERLALDMPAVQLVAAMPGVNEGTIQDLLRRGFAVALHTTTRLGYLTLNERTALARALREGAR